MCAYSFGEMASTISIEPALTGYNYLANCHVQIQFQHVINLRSLLEGCYCFSS